MNSSLITSVALVLLLIGGAIVLTQRPAEESATNTNVRIENGQQIVEINAKGGYSPRTTTVQAGMPTILKVKTEGTYDCSSALTILALNYRKTLAATEVTDIEIPAQEAGTSIQGVCAMGMYNFSINFI